MLEKLNKCFFVFAFLKEAFKRLFFGLRPKPEQKIRFGIGKGLLMRLDPYSSSQRILGLYEMEVQKHFKAYANKCEYFFDVGASDGYYSLIYRKHNKQGKMFLCDAGTGWAQLEKENFVLNNFVLTNVLFESEKWIGDEGDGVHIKIDDLLHETDKDCFIKIDVDGTELHVLRSGVNLLRNNRCRLIVETHSLELEKACIDFLSDLQYECKVIKNSFLRIIFPECRAPLWFNRWLIATKAPLGPLT
jgi:hypothetical protein